MEPFVNGAFAFTGLGVILAVFFVGSALGFVAVAISSVMAVRVASRGATCSTVEPPRESTG